MRWTKGKPQDQAPFGVPVLTVYQPHDGQPIYAILTRKRGPWVNDGPGGPRPTYGWEHADGRYYMGTPHRFWLLPGRENG